MSEKVASLFERLSASVGPMAKLPNNGASYHTGEQVITHLNRVLGPQAWSFVILASGEEVDSEECWVLGQITAVIDGETVVKQDYGSQAFKRTKDRSKFVSKGEDRKAAATDALKRCARLLGAGLDAWANERAPSWRPVQTCDKARWNRAWHAAVKDTRFADDDTRHKFIRWFTDGAQTSLSDFLDTATDEDAEALVATVMERIADEARKAARSAAGQAGG